MSQANLPSLDLTSGLARCSLVNTLTGSPVRRNTEVEASISAEVLTLKYRCEDPSICATMTERDAPLYEEDVVEVFLSPGEEAPRRYFEFEVSPNGVLWDGYVESPNLGRPGMMSHAEWNCPNLEWGAERDDGDNVWTAYMHIPLAELCEGEVPDLWRFNLYRIDRSEGEEDEFQAWSPTLADPADFHVPERFGYLRI